MKRKLFTAFTIICIMLLTCGVLNVSAATYGDLTYEISNSKITITECKTSASGDLVIPSKINGYPVISIHNYAFMNCDKLTGITIPDTVTSIGSSAFYNCRSLTNINIPDTVTSISPSAFYNTGYYNDSSNWENDVFYAGNHLIEAKTSISGSYTIKDGTKYIAPYAFENCISLTAITIPDSVISIDSYAFFCCSNLTSISLSNNLTFIGSNTFANCNNLEKVYITDIAAYLNCNYEDRFANPMYHAEKLYLNNKRVVNLNIPDTVTQIPLFAFYSCDSLQSVTIPDSVTSIGDNAFDNCISITGITIPNSVKTIGNYAFYDCSGLTSITIPDSVTSIGEKAFGNCSNLTTFTMGKGVTSIGKNAFYYCNNLSGVYIPDIARWCNINFSDSFSNPAYYTKNLYFNGELLTDLVIPDGVTSIGTYAFYNFTNLTSVTIPDSITNISTDAFGNCNFITGVYITDIEAWCNIDFASSYSNPTYYSKNLYLNGELITDLVIPDGVTRISSYAFYNCSPLKNIMMPDSVTSIGSYAFYRCDNLKSIIIPDSVTSIDSCAFNTCSLLSSVIIPDSVTSIGSSAFASCSNLTDITIPDSVTSIGYGSFYNCNKLTNMTIPFIGSSRESSGTTDAVLGYIFGSSITPYTNATTAQYYSANALKYYYIPSSLKSVTITDDATIPYGAFYNCYNLTNITLADNTASIGYFAFYNCSKLTDVEIGKNVEMIGASAFAKCSNLETIIIPKSVTEIEINAFADCSGIKTVKYSGTSDEWSEIYIGSGNDYLKNAEIIYDYVTPVTLKTEMSDNTFVVYPDGAPDGCSILFVCYKDKVPVYVDMFTYQGEKSVPFTTTTDYDEVKIMAWGSMKDIIPLCESDLVSVNL